MTREHLRRKLLRGFRRNKNWALLATLLTSVAVLVGAPQVLAWGFCGCAVALLALAALQAKLYRDCFGRWPFGETE